MKNISSKEFARLTGLANYSNRRSELTRAIDTLKVNHALLVDVAEYSKKTSLAVYVHGTFAKSGKSFKTKVVADKSAYAILRMK